MTAAEGAELATAGYIVADPMQVGPVPGSVRVTITDAGRAALQAPAPAVDAKPIVSAVVVGVAMPAPLKRGGNNNLKPRESIYGFNDLPEPTYAADGTPMFGSFHVAKTASNPEPWKSMASNVSAANKRSEVAVLDANGQPVLETVEKKALVKGADKKPVLDSEGNKQYTVTTETRQAMKATKKFIARRVNAQDPNGEGVRVFRVPLDYQG